MIPRLVTLSFYLFLFSSSLVYDRHTDKEITASDEGIEANQATLRISVGLFGCLALSQPPYEISLTGADRKQIAQLIDQTWLKSCFNWIRFATDFSFD